MNTCTLRFLRNRSGSDDTDDIIRVFEDDDFDGMYRVVFRPEGVKKSSVFYLNREGVVRYVSTILKTLMYDTLPFQDVQVDTVLHPSVLYHVSDLDDRDVRILILDTIEDALRASVERSRQ